LLLATSLSPKTLWYLGVIAFAPVAALTLHHKSDEHSRARHAAFQRHVVRAAVAILEAIPGPCFPVRLVLDRTTLWELRPRRKMHGQWFVQVPMAVHAAQPSFLPPDFFVNSIDHRPFGAPANAFSKPWTLALEDKGLEIRVRGRGAPLLVAQRRHGLHRTSSIAVSPGR